jgi:hypothetical protein
VKLWAWLNVFKSHAFFKVFQYATTKKRMCKGLKYVSIKSTQAYLQKCITWFKMLGNGKQKWMKVCIALNTKNSTHKSKQGDIQVTLLLFYVFFESSYCRIFPYDCKSICVGLQVKRSSLRMFFNFYKLLSLVITNKLMLGSLAMHPSSHMTYIANYYKHFVSYCHYFYFKPIKRSLVVE